MLGKIKCKWKTFGIEWLCVFPWRGSLWFHTLQWSSLQACSTSVHPNSGHSEAKIWLKAHLAPCACARCHVVWSHRLEVPMDSLKLFRNEGWKEGKDKEKIFSGLVTFNSNQEAYSGGNPLVLFIVFCHGGAPDLLSAKNCNRPRALPSSTPSAGKAKQKYMFPSFSNSSTCQNRPVFPCTPRLR